MVEHYPSGITQSVKSNVLIGCENTLFLWQGAQRQFDYLTQALKPTKESIKNFSDNIKSRKNFLEGIGIEYKHIVFPSKPTILSDQLPQKLVVSSIYEKYYGNVENVFYSREKLLLDYSIGRKPFRKLDTHLNDSGFLSCLKDALSDDFKLFEEKGYRYKAVNRLMSGDLEKMINTESPSTTSEYIMKPLDIHGSNIEFEESDNIQEISGNTGNIVVLKALNPIKKQRLLIFGDSFIRKGLRLLCPIYSEIIYFRSQFFRPELVSVLRPDIVLTANAERYLCNVENDEETPFWCSSNFQKSFSLNGNKKSMRLLYHLRGLSSKSFSSQKYQSYLTDTASLMRNKNNSYDGPIDEWFNEPRQRSSGTYIIDQLNSRNKEFISKIKFEPVARTSPSNGSIRSLATYIYRGELNKNYLTNTFFDKVLRIEPKSLVVLCLLRLENILSQTTGLQVTSHEASELFCSCNILNKLLEYNSGEIKEWIIQTIDVLVDNDSKIYLAELFKACYLFGPYLNVLKLASPTLINDIYLSEKQTMKKYFKKLYDLDRSSLDFINLIEGKKVAVVGPSSCGQFLGEEIDSFDTVIRMSVDDSSNLNKIVTGLKTTISYFSGHTAKSQEKIIDLASSIPFFSISLPKFAPQLFQRVGNRFQSKYSHVRQTVELNYVKKLLRYTSPNLLQVILIDILRYNPSQVKVFYSNMFAKKTYDSSYKSVKGLRQRSGATQSYTLSSLTMLNHDPITNFLLIKTLFMHSFFEADPILCDVLQMEPEQYLSSLKSNIIIEQ